MSQKRLRCILTAITLATLPYVCASMFTGQSQLTIKAEKNKAFNESCLFATFKITSGNIADCLEHCLEDCRCQSFQICQNTKCQLCSSHKEANSSLLHDKDGCIYAIYEMRHLIGTVENLNDQCSSMSCLMKYNCCQQSGLCPKNKICKQLNSQEQPWKRFTCKCPDGYDGNNCDQPITSCQGYARGSPMSGMYKVLDSTGSLYEVYCHFDSHRAWTLVQSYTFENGSYDVTLQEFKKPIHENHPVSENTPTWRGYRLSKARMKSVQNNSVLLLFTCDYERHHDVNKSDYLRIPLEVDNNKNIDILQLENGRTSISTHEGKIGGIQSKDCKIWLNHYDGWPLHIHISDINAECKLSQLAMTSNSCQYWPNSAKSFHYFGGYLTNCFDKAHLCVQKNNSTSQLWFGHM